MYPGIYYVYCSFGVGMCSDKMWLGTYILLFEIRLNLLSDKIICNLHIVTFNSKRHHYFQSVQLRTISHKDSLAQSRSFNFNIHCWIPGNISGPPHHSDIVSIFLGMIFEGCEVKRKLQTSAIQHVHPCHYWGFQFSLDTHSDWG